MTQVFETIKLENQDNFFILTLNRPESYNSINILMHQELKQALKEIKKNNARALLITGNGKGFCSGQDLNDRKSLGSKELQKVDLGESIDLRYNPLIKSLVSLPFPTVCAVNGVAAGAGVSIALSCDIVLASDTASFVLAFSKIGLIPDSGTTWLLPRLIGNARAIGAMMLAEKITAEQAENWGMIWKKVEQETLLNEAKKLAIKLANMPTQSLKQIKMATFHSWDNSLNEQLNLERDLQSLLGKTVDYEEGVSAFLEKRQAQFKGE